MADRFLTPKKNLAGKTHFVAKEVQQGSQVDPCPIQVDDFNTTTLENGKLYYLTQDCLYGDDTYYKGYYTYNNDAIQRLDKVIVELGNFPETAPFELEIDHETMLKLVRSRDDAIIIAGVGGVPTLFRLSQSSLALVYYSGTDYRIVVAPRFAITGITGKAALSIRQDVKADDGLKITSGTIGHSNDEITAGTFSAGTVSDTSSATADGGKLTFRKQSYDEFGHQVSDVSDDATLIIGNGLQISSGTLKHTNSITQGSFATTYAANVINLAGGNYDKNGHITGVNNTNKITFTGGLKSGTTGTVEHTNSITSTGTNNKVWQTQLDAQGHHTGTQTGYGVQKKGGTLSDDDTLLITSGKALEELNKKTTCIKSNTSLANRSALLAYFGTTPTAETIILSDVTFTTTSEIPAGVVGGSLIIVNNHYNKSIFTVHLINRGNGNTGIEYVCTYTGSAWSAWKKILDSGDIVTSVETLANQDNASDDKVPSAKSVHDAVYPANSFVQAVSTSKITIGTTKNQIYTYHSTTLSAGQWVCFAKISPDLVPIGTANGYIRHSIATNGTTGCDSDAFGINGLWRWGMQNVSGYFNLTAPTTVYLKGQHECSGSINNWSFTAVKIR